MKQHNGLYVLVYNAKLQSNFNYEQNIISEIGLGGLNIKMSSCQNKDPHVEDKTVSWPGKTVFILRRGPGNI